MMRYRMEQARRPRRLWGHAEYQRSENTDNPRDGCFTPLPKKKEKKRVLIIQDGGKRGMCNQCRQSFPESKPYSRFCPNCGTMFEKVEDHSL